MTEIAGAAKIVTANSSRRAAQWMDIGNLITTCSPVLIPIWFGVSMFIYAMNRHHPNERVGYHTQWAAYRFYGMIGLVIPVATFFPVDIGYYLILWAVLAVIMVPWTIISLRKIRQEQWHDIAYTEELESNA